jgi:hypothetical protein
MWMKDFQKFGNQMETGGGTFRQSKFSSLFKWT